MAENARFVWGQKGGRMKELTLAGGKHALELKRQQAQREISLCR